MALSNRMPKCVIVLVNLPKLLYDCQKFVQTALIRFVYLLVFILCSLVSMVNNDFRQTYHFQLMVCIVIMRAHSFAPQIAKFRSAVCGIYK